MTTSGKDWPRSLLWITLMVAIAIAWSGIAPYDRLTWYLELFPIAIALPVLYLTARRFPLTPFLYWLIGFHCLILTLGAHYTYARVPLGFWVQDIFDFSRNNYDRLGHFVQGFVPAIAVREVLKRESPVRGRRLARLPDGRDLPRGQRLLRIPRMVDRSRIGCRGRRVPGDPGRHLGHAMGHVPRHLRRDRGHCDALARA